MDLADTICTVQYQNEKDEDGRIYLVPFFDITTYKKENKILIPWQISGEATRNAGTITFSVRFFKLNDFAENGKKDYIYSLNTEPAVSKILYGMDIDPENNENLYIPADIVTQLMNDIERVSRQSNLYWIEI